MSSSSCPRQQQDWVVQLFPGNRRFACKSDDVTAFGRSAPTAARLIHHVVEKDSVTQKTWARHGPSFTDVLQVSVKATTYECPLEDFEVLPEVLREVQRFVGGGEGAPTEVHLVQNLLKYEAFRRPELVFLTEFVRVKPGSVSSEVQELNGDLEICQDLACQLIYSRDFEEIRISKAQRGEVCLKGPKLKRNAEDIIDLTDCRILHSHRPEELQIILVGRSGVMVVIWYEKRKHFNCWLSALRLSKFGSRLRAAFLGGSCADEPKDEKRPSDAFKKLMRFGMIPSGGLCKSRSSSTSSRSSFLSSSAPTSLSSSASASKFFSIFDHHNRSSIDDDEDEDDDVEDAGGGHHVEDDVLVAVRRSVDGEFNIVTDPAKVDQIKRHEMLRRRRSTNLQHELMKAPWYTVRSADAVHNVLRRYGAGIDGVFLVRSSNFRSPEQPDLDTFALMLVADDDVVVTFRVLQKPMFNRTVFTLDHGLTSFPSVEALVEFYQYNKGVLPCVLTEYPRL